MATARPPSCWMVIINTLKLPFWMLGGLGLLLSSLLAKVSRADLHWMSWALGKHLFSSYLRERDRMLLSSILCGGVWIGFLLGESQKFLAGIAEVLMMMVICFGIVSFSPWFGLGIQTCNTNHTNHTTTTPPQHHHNTTTTPPQHHHNTTTTPPQHHHNTTTTPPQHLHHTTTTQTPHHLHHHTTTTHHPPPTTHHPPPTTHPITHPITHHPPTHLTHPPTHPPPTHHPPPPTTTHHHTPPHTTTHHHTPPHTTTHHHTPPPPHHTPPRTSTHRTAPHQVQTRPLHFPVRSVCIRGVMLAAPSVATNRPSLAAVAALSQSWATVLGLRRMIVHEQPSKRTA